jgi:hypothetical protein
MRSGTSTTIESKWFIIPVIATAAGLLAVGIATAQERRRVERTGPAGPPFRAAAPITMTNPPPTTLPAPAERRVQVFRLRNVDASVAASAIATLGNASVTTDPRTNSLVVCGSPEAIEKAKELLSELDVPEKPGAGQQFRIFTLKYADPKFTARALQDTFGREAQITADPATRALIVKAEPATMERIAPIIQALDVPTAQTPGEVPEVRVFTRKHTSAESDAATLQTVLGDGLKVTAQESTNSIIVKGTPAAIRQCEDLLAKLDREPLAPAEPGVRIFRLTNRKLDDGIRKAVELLVGNRGAVAFDEKTNSIIVKGDKAVLDMAAQTVEQLDKPVATSRPAAEAAELPSLRIRVVWLAQGLNAAEGEFPPPPDLDGVVEDLARLGVTNLRLVAQTMIGSIGEGKFRLTAAPEIADVDNCVLKLDGDVRPNKAAPQIRLQLSASGIVRPPEPAGPGPQPPRPRFQTEFGNIETVVAAPLGHAVVLGVTPTLKTTSVFVIQLLPGN